MVKAKNKSRHSGDMTTEEQELYEAERKLAEQKRALWDAEKELWKAELTHNPNLFEPLEAFAAETKQAIEEARKLLKMVTETEGMQGWSEYIAKHPPSGRVITQLLIAYADHVKSISARDNTRKKHVSERKLITFAWKKFKEQCINENRQPNKKAFINNFRKRNRMSVGDRTISEVWLK